MNSAIPEALYSAGHYYSDTIIREINANIFQVKLLLSADDLRDTELIINMELEVGIENRFVPLASGVWQGSASPSKDGVFHQPSFIQTSPVSGSIPFRVSFETNKPIRASLEFGVI